MKICQHCGQEFVVPRRHPRQKYCGTTCRDAAKTTRVQRACATCGKPVVRPAERAARLPHSFCNRECYAAWLRKNAARGAAHVQYSARVPVRCDACGETVYRVPSEVNRHNFCGVECRLTWQRESGYITGANSPTWRGGHNDYRGPNWLRQRKAALDRDNHRCTRCDKTAGLQVHHIRPYVTFDSYLLANELANLTTHCLSCHKTAEWEYWRAHPDDPRLKPDTTRIHTCRKCGEEYAAYSPRSLDCDDCAPAGRASRRVLSAARTATPSPTAPQ